VVRRFSEWYLTQKVVQGTTGNCRRDAESWVEATAEFRLARAGSGHRDCPADFSRKRAPAEFYSGTMCAPPETL